jgi:hypothetical protein
VLELVKIELGARKMTSVGLELVDLERWHRVLVRSLNNQSSKHHALGGGHAPSAHRPVNDSHDQGSSRRAFL